MAENEKVKAVLLLALFRLLNYHIFVVHHIIYKFVIDYGITG